jgi:enamine deaminase RidA (YjgF/YER057c/UK114 family)
MSMQRTAVNPWPWSLQYAYNQGEVIEGPQRMLICAGQTATDANGAPVHGRDIAAQFALALDNLDSVLAAGGMTLGDVVRLTIYTTDVDALLPHYGLLVERLAGADVMPPATLLGVVRLAFPELLVEVEATAIE